MLGELVLSKLKGNEDVKSYFSYTTLSLMEYVSYVLQEKRTMFSLLSTTLGKPLCVDGGTVAFK